MSQLLRWSFLSAFMLIITILTIYLSIVAYVKITLDPVRARGISVSEEVSQISGMLSLADSCIGGLLVLAAIMLFWSIVTRHVPEAGRNSNYPRAIELSLLIIPFAFAIAYALIRYAWYYLWR